MKKSQILAALALAFALGVVAPISSASAKYATGYTAEQTTEMNNLVSYANILAGSIKNLTNYANLYSVIETANTGARAQLNKVITAAAKVYNDTPAKADSVMNSFITNANLLGSVVFADANLKQDASAAQATPFTLKNLSTIGTTASDLKAAYDALNTLAANAIKNAEILEQNYKYDANDASNQVTQAYNAYMSVVGGATDQMSKIEAEINKFSADAASSLTALSAIDEEAYNKMIASDAWKDAEKNANTKNAVRWGLIINLAESLPKYNLVAPVVNAKANFDKLLPTNDTVVQFEQGKGFVTAYTDALIAFRDGTTTNPGDQQPTDPDTKPGDDSNKDDNKTPTSPDTGILSTAEGSASTTISIVAGLATALTALGAGVVAYRNARRSSEK